MAGDRKPGAKLDRRRGVAHALLNSKVDVPAIAEVGDGAFRVLRDGRVKIYRLHPNVRVKGEEEDEAGGSTSKL